MMIVPKLMSEVAPKKTLTANGNFLSGHGVLLYREKRIFTPFSNFLAQFVKILLNFVSVPIF